MKALAISFLLLLFSLKINAQLNAEYSSKKGKSIISASYGIGNVWVYFLEHNSLIKDIPDYQVSSIGPFTVCYENFISNKISIGITTSYSIVKGETKRFLVDEQISIFTALARANYHFGHSNKFDPYLGGGLGYVRSVYRNNTSIPGPVPGEFGYSAQIGAHYYLTKKAGFFGELGYVNGSFLQLGFVLRFF
ncbi:MAG: outer membrane beta-barrel protein [Bacteroidota bacterium]